MAAQLNASDARGWLSAVKDFDSTARAVNANARALIQLADQSKSWPAAMRAQYRQQLENGLAAQTKLSDLAGVRATVGGWLQKVMPQQLGAVPVAVVVAVGLTAFAAAIATAKVFLSGVADFAAQYKTYTAEQERLIAQGLDPKRASEQAQRVAAGLAKSSAAPGMFERLGTRALWIGGAVALAVLVLPKFLAARRR